MFLCYKLGFFKTLLAKWLVRNHHLAEKLYSVGHLIEIKSYFKHFSSISMHSLAAGSLSGWRAVSLQQRSGVIRLCDIFYFCPATICRVGLLLVLCQKKFWVCNGMWELELSPSHGQGSPVAGRAWWAVLYHPYLRNTLWKVWIRCQSFDSPPSLQFSGVTAVPENGLRPKRWVSPPHVLTAYEPALGTWFLHRKTMKEWFGLEPESWKPESSSCSCPPCHGEAWE